MRAIIRLAQGGRRRGSLRAMVKALKRASRRLGGPRDAQATLAVFQKLVSPAGAARFPHVLKALEKKSKQEGRRYLNAGFQGAILKALKKLQKHTDDLKMRAAGWAAVELGLSHGYQCARQAMKDAAENPTPENFHTWRKHTKCFQHQLGSLFGKGPTGVRAFIKRLEKLGEWLGDDHDLYLLREFVARECPACVEEGALLTRMIEARRKVLCNNALKLGSPLFAEAPGAVCRRLRSFGMPDTIKSKRRSAGKRSA